MTLDNNENLTPQVIVEGIPSDLRSLMKNIVCASDDFALETHKSAFDRGKRSVSVEDVMSYFDEHFTITGKERPKVSEAKKKYTSNRSLIEALVKTTYPEPIGENRAEQFKNLFQSVKMF